MKYIVIIFLALAAVSAAPVEESVKTKRGVYGTVGLGHSLFAAPAPLLHSAPLFHAPLAFHAPFGTPAPLVSAPLVSKTVVPHYSLELSAPLAYNHAPLALGLGHSFW